jgi:hypothetical protein
MLIGDQQSELRNGPVLAKPPYPARQWVPTGENLGTKPA